MQQPIDRERALQVSDVKHAQHDRTKIWTTPQESRWSVVNRNRPRNKHRGRRQQRGTTKRTPVAPPAEEKSPATSTKAPEASPEADRTPVASPDPDHDVPATTETTPEKPALSTATRDFLPTPNTVDSAGDSSEAPAKPPAHEPADSAAGWQQGLVGKDIIVLVQYADGSGDNGWFPGRVDHIHAEDPTRLHIVFSDGDELYGKLDVPYCIDGTVYVQGKPSDTVAPPAPSDIT